MDIKNSFDELILDRRKFNEFVYTPLSEALRLLEERQKDPVLIAKIEKLLDGDIPDFFKNNKKCAVQFRQIATPNNDAKNFLRITKDFNLNPIFMEYHSDKFSSNNSFKRSLGQLQIQGLVNKKDAYRMEKISIMDFNKHNGKILKNAVTLWNEPLIDFHRKLFKICELQDQACNFFDSSDWIKKHGEKPENFYKQFLLIFTCFGVLFENFLTENEDKDFTEKVIIPAINYVIISTGVKPLIIPIGPLDMEIDDYWVSYNFDVKKFLENK